MERKLKPRRRKLCSLQSPTQWLIGAPAVAQRVFESAAEEARQQGLLQRPPVRRLTAPKGFLIKQRFACHHNDQMFEHTLPGSENIQQGFLNPRFLRV